MEVGIKFLIVFSLFFSSVSHADEKTDRILKSFAEEYTKQLIKDQVKGFINANPQIFGSGSGVDGSSTGAEVMQFVGYVIAAYNLAHAKNDKEKMYAIASVVATFVPYGAAILLVCQVTDTAFAAENARHITHTYKKVMQLERETAEIWTQISLENVFYQYSLTSGLGNLSTEIVNTRKAFLENPFTQFLLDKTKDEPSQIDSEKAFILVGKLHRLILDYETLYIMYEAIVNPQLMQLTKKQMDGFRQFRDGLLPLKTELSKVRKSVKYLFAAALANDQLEKINKVRRRSSSRNRIYLRCTRLINQRLDAVLLNSEDTDDLSSEMVADCEKIFHREATNEI